MYATTVMGLNGPCSADLQEDPSLKHAHAHTSDSMLLGAVLLQLLRPAPARAHL